MFSETVLFSREYGAMKGTMKAIFVGNTGFSLYHFRLPLMKELMREGWEVVAIAKDEGDFGQAFNEQGFHFISVPIDHKGQNPIKDLILTIALTNLYMTERPFLVHHFTIKPVIFGSLAAKCARVPTIVNTITGLGYTFEKPGLVHALAILLYRLALSGKPKVIFQNGDDLGLFARKGIGGGQRFLIRGSGVDSERIRPVPKAGGSRHVTFLLVGRMLWSKGVREFEQAAAIVKERFPDASFLMVGGHSGGGAEASPDAIPLEWLKELSRRGTVNWYGRVPFDEVLHLMDKADVIVLPSYREGLPRSLLDAAAKGKAIITTDTPGCREVVVNGFNGFLVPVKNSTKLAECMVRFIKEPELISKMGAKSRERVETIFDDQIVIQKTLQVYN